MKLQSISLRNWRQHRWAECDIDPVTIIVGPNNSGKTGILAAIEMALCGVCQLTDERGLGGQLRTLGASEPWSVTLQLADGCLIERQEGGKLLVSWEAEALTSRRAQAALEERFGRSLDMVRLAIRGGSFFDLPDNRRKAMLGRILDLEITPDRVQEALRSRGEELGMPLLETALKVTGSRAGLAAIERTYQACYATRTGANRALKDQQLRVDDLQAVVDAQESDWIPEEKGKALAELVDELKSKLRVLDAERGSLGAKVRDLDLALQPSDAPGRIERLGIASRELEDSAKRKNFVVECSEEGWERLEQMHNSLAESLQQWRKLKNAHAIAIGDVQRLAEQRLVLEAKIEGLGKCAYDREHPCPGSIGQKASLLTEIGGLRLDLQAKTDAAADLQAELDSLVDYQGRKMEGRAEAAQTELAWVADQKSGLRRLLSQRADLAERIARQATSLNLEESARAQAQLDLPAAQDSLRAAESEAERISVALRRTERELEAAREIVRNSNQLRKERALLEKCRASQAAIEQCVQFFAPSGFQAEVITQNLDPFVTQVNSVLKRWHREARYRDLHLEVSRLGSEAWLDYDSLSESDQILVELAHQVAFAVLSKCGLVVIDCIEAIDDERQEVLFEACVDIQAETPGVDHILLLGVRALGSRVPVVDLGFTNV